MNDPTDARSKAEASHRLAELAKTPRARELFRQLAEEYENRARGEPKVELMQQAEAAPSIAPLMSADEAAPDEVSASAAPVVATVPLVPAAPTSAPVSAQMSPAMSAPMADTTQWLSNLASIRVVS
jgi:hypothetical protein